MEKTLETKTNVGFTGELLTILVEGCDINRWTDTSEIPNWFFENDSNEHSSWSRFWNECFKDFFMMQQYSCSRRYSVYGFKEGLLKCRKLKKYFQL